MPVRIDDIDPATQYRKGRSAGRQRALVGGRIDNLMMRLVDILYSIPFIFVVIFILTILSSPRADLAQEPLLDKEKVFFLVIGAIYWLTMARVVRGQVLSLKHSEFIEAARVVGASTARILFVHIVPNVLSIVIVYLTLTMLALGRRLLSRRRGNVDLIHRLGRRRLRFGSLRCSFRRCRRISRGRRI